MNIFDVLKVNKFLIKKTNPAVDDFLKELSLNELTEIDFLFPCTQILLL